MPSLRDAHANIKKQLELFQKRRDFITHCNLFNIPEHRRDMKNLRIVYELEYINKHMKDAVQQAVGIPDAFRGASKALSGLSYEQRRDRMSGVTDALRGLKKEARKESGRY